MPGTPLGEEALAQKETAPPKPLRGHTVIEYELIKQHEYELQAQARHERLVREAKTVKRTGWRPNVGFRAQRRTVRATEC